MSVYLVPGVFGAGGQVLDTNGKPASGALVNTYAAGTTSTVQVFTTSVGNVAAANPVVCNSDGRLPYELWQTAGQSIKITVTDSLLNTLGTYDNLTGVNDPSNFATTLTDKRTETGAQSFTLHQFNQTRTVYAHLDFNVVADGATDDTSAMSNFINSAIANPGVRHVLPVGTIKITSALPSINVSYVWIEGAGTSSHHDLGSLDGTTIKYSGAAGATMLTVAPTSNIANRRIDGVKITGINFDCNQLAARGILFQSIRNGTLNVYCAEATTAGLEMGVVASLAEGRDCQFNRIYYWGHQQFQTAPALLLNGDAIANVSLNDFMQLDLWHKDGTAFVCINPDNNNYYNTRVFCAGTATNSIEWRGGATSVESTRDEHYLFFTATKAAIAKGTGTYTVAAKRIFIDIVDKGNGTPDPTIETGASVIDGQWRSYTPTATSGTGTITTSTATGRYRRRSASKVDIEINLAITTNGTGASYIRMTLPKASGPSALAQNVTGIETAISGKTLRGLIVTNSSNCDIDFYDATYPGVDGANVSVAGSYETSPSD